MEREEGEMSDDNAMLVDDYEPPREKEDVKSVKHTTVSTSFSGSGLKTTHIQASPCQILKTKTISTIGSKNIFICIFCYKLDEFGCFFFHQRCAQLC